MSEGNANADGCEIEITPEMIKAGVSELSWFDPAEDSWETRAEVVKEIYSEMARIVRSNNATACGSSSASRSDHVGDSPILSNIIVSQDAESI